MELYRDQAKQLNRIPVHIAFLTPEYPHAKATSSAGLGNSIKNLAEALAVHNTLVSVFAYSQKEDAVVVENGVKIHLIKHRNYRYFGWFLYRKYLERYISEHVKSDNIDLLEVPDWTGISAFMKFEIPVVMRFHGSDAYFCRLENRKQKRKNFWFERNAAKRALAYIAPTDFAGRLSSEIFHLDPAKITTIHYGLELEKFGNPFPEKFEKNLILYIGTIIRKKGVFELPGIFSKVLAGNPAAKLILIGADSNDIETHSKSTWEILKHEFGEMNRSVVYAGKIPYSEVQDFIRKANVCVFPSYAETLGMVTLESMAMQKPVVNTNIGWANELIVDGESGFLAHPSNHDYFAERIIQILNDSGLALEMGKKAYQRVSAVFDVEKTVRQNLQLYQKFLPDEKA